MQNKRLKIAIYGSADEKEPEILYKIANIIGSEIAKSGNIIITGACRGLPFQAVKGSKSNGGYSIGYSCVVNKDDHEKIMNTSLKYYDELILIPKDYIHKNNVKICRKYRNVSSVADCDAAIFISGRWGTLNEFAISNDMGKVIGVYNSKEGKFSSCVKSLLNLFNKKSDAKIIYNDNPIDLCKNIINLLKVNGI